ncbi:MAG TPA: hypothetical protein VFG41_01470 [Sphingomicrobium sp.]|jgi:hypothetical protein|nr:hypothetical protein [Sphingomicrobium sp.]
MVDEEIDLKEQIQRCRRLASMITDEQLRHSLEKLAQEYEARLKRTGEGFMLRHKSDSP